MNTKLKIASYFLSGLAGILLTLAGVYVTSWHFWAITFTLATASVVDHIRGYNKGREYKDIK